MKSLSLEFLSREHAGAAVSAVSALFPQVKHAVEPCQHAVEPPLWGSRLAGGPFGCTKHHLNGLPDALRWLNGAGFRTYTGAAEGLDRAEHERLEGRAVHAALLVQPVVYN